MSATTRDHISHEWALLVGGGSAWSGCGLSRDRGGSERPDHDWFATIFADAQEKSRALTHHYRALADFMNIDFLAAGSVTTTDGVDGIHFTAENNRDLGEAVAGRVRAILG